MYKSLEELPPKKNVGNAYWEKRFKEIPEGHFLEIEDRNEGQRALVSLNGYHRRKKLLEFVGEVRSGIVCISHKKEGN